MVGVPGDLHTYYASGASGGVWKSTREVELTRQGPLVVPGTYTVKLTVDGHDQTETVEVVKDPNTTGTLDAILVWRNLLGADGLRDKVGIAIGWAALSFMHSYVWMLTNHRYTPRRDVHHARVLR